MGPARTGTVTRRGLLMGAALALPAAGTGAQPSNRPVTVLVGFPAGGVADIICRIVTERLRTLAGVPVVIENRGGAGGTIAAAAVARAAGDGHTLLFVTSGHAGNAALYASLPYDGVRDFAPVSGVAQSPVVILVPARSRYTSLAALVADARGRPGALNYAAAAGGATLPALGASVFRRELGLDITAVNYRGTAPALAGLIGGETDFAFDLVAGSIGLIQGGQLRALAVTSASRAGVLPDVPTVAETVLPGFEVTGWFGMLAPAATPPSEIARWQGLIRQAVTAPEVRARLLEIGADPMPLSAEEFAALIARESTRWTGVIQRLGLRAE